MKISSQAVDSYVEAMRRRYQRDVVKEEHEAALWQSVNSAILQAAKQIVGPLTVSPTWMDRHPHAQVIVEQRVETARPVVTTPTPLLGEDSGSLERFRRVFATWDFRNGA